MLLYIMSRDNLESYQSESQDMSIRTKTFQWQDDDYGTLSRPYYIPALSVGQFRNALNINLCRQRVFCGFLFFAVYKCDLFY